MPRAKSLSGPSGLRFPTEAVLLMAALLSAAAQADEAAPSRASRVRIPLWLPFAVLIALAIASLSFGLLHPELVAAPFGGG
jgi:hypothetical protein